MKSVMNRLVCSEALLTRSDVSGGSLGNTQRRYRLGTRSYTHVYIGIVEGIVSRCRLKAVVMSE